MTIDKIKLDQQCKTNEYNKLDLEKFKISNFFTTIKLYKLLQVFISNRVIVAGGSILRSLTNEPPNDIDLYFKDIRDMDRFINELSERFNIKTNADYISNNAISFSINDVKMQIIILPEMISLTAAELINKFDYSICQIAYDFEFDDFVYNDQFFKDINSKRMHFNIKCAHPISSIFRSYKYCNRGYYLPSMEMIKLALKINEIKIETFGDVINELKGISTTYLEDFVEMLKLFADKKFDIVEMFSLLDEYKDSKKIAKLLK